MSRPRTVQCYRRDPKPWHYLEGPVCFFCQSPLAAHITRAYHAEEQGVMEIVWLPGEPWPAP